MKNLLIALLILASSVCFAADPIIVSDGARYVYVIDKDNVARGIRIDDSSSGIVTTTFPHSELHEASTYQTNISDADISTSPLRIKMVIPAQEKRIHMLAFGVSSGASIFTITENPTGGATGGSALTAFNKRRDSANTTTATLTQGVTAPTGGTVLGPDPERHGFDKDKISGETRDTAEWILGKTGSIETYVFELESGTGDVIGNLLLV